MRLHLLQSIVALFTIMPRCEKNRKFALGFVFDHRSNTLPPNTLPLQSNKRAKRRVTNDGEKDTSQPVLASVGVLWWLRKHTHVLCGHTHGPAQVYTHT